MRVVLVAAILCVAVMVSTAQAGPAPVTIVDVEAPAINCIFDLDCTIVVTDTTDHFTLDGTVGDAFLQSRTFPPGEPGTVAEGLFGYEYRLDLRELVGVLHIPCITAFRIEFGPLVPLDYDDNGVLDDVFVVTRGGLGNVAPTSTNGVGNTFTFNFDPPVCAGGSPGKGESTFFFGLTSSLAPHAVLTQVRDTSGLEYTLNARAPASDSLDHFKCYPTQGNEPVDASVFLQDQLSDMAKRGWMR
jgi:hypothetical protein